MWTTYRAILARIERDPLVVLRRRVHVPCTQKLWLTGLRTACEVAESRYRFRPGRRWAMAV